MNLAGIRWALILGDYNSSHLAGLGRSYWVLRLCGHRFGLTVTAGAVAASALLWPARFNREDRSGGWTVPLEHVPGSQVEDREQPVIEVSMHHGPMIEERAEDGATLRVRRRIAPLVLGTNRLERDQFGLPWPERPRPW